MSDDLLSLLPKLELSRRDFVMTTLAAGFALSVQPVSADTITTDTKGLDAGEVKIPVADGTIPAYQAKPRQRWAVPDRAGDPGNLRRPRAYQGRLPPPSPSSATSRSPPNSTPGKATFRR